MCRTNTEGFTLIELLVVLLLSSLTLSLVIPSLMRSSLSNAEILTNFQTAMLRFSASVSNQQSSQRIDTNNKVILANLLDVGQESLSITDTLIFAKSGACLAGSFDYIQDQFALTFKISSPLCTLTIENED